MLTKFACFLTARTRSSRLPDKPLLLLQNKMVIQHSIDRVKLAKKADEIILCTSDDPSDDILEKVALKNGIKVFRGSLNDLPQRWLEAAKQFKVDYFLKVDGADDLFCDPFLVDLAIEQMKENPCDCLEVPSSLVCGGAAHCIAVYALHLICEMKGNKEMEDCSPYFMNSKMFRVRDLKIDDPIYHNVRVRLTMDYPEDYQFFKSVFKKLAVDTNNVPLKNILEFLRQHPELVAINFFRQEDYLKNRRRKGLA